MSKQNYLEKVEIIPESVSEVIWVYDLTDSIFLFVWPYFDGSLPQKQHDVFNENVTATIFEISKNFINEISQKGYESYSVFIGNSYLDKIEQVSKEGAKLLVEISSHYESNPINNHIYIFGVSRNITGKEKNVGQLNQKLQYLESIINSTNSLIYIVDLENRFLMVNNQTVSLFGANLEDIIGSKRNKYLPPEIVALHEANDKIVANAKKSITIEEINEEKDGIHYYLTVKYPLIDNKNEVYAVCGISTDITEKRKQEKELQLSNEKFYVAFHNNPACMIITRISDGLILDVNQSFCELFEFTKQEVIGKDSIVLGIIVNEERRRIITEQILAGGLKNHLLKAKTKSGKNLDLLFSSSEIKINDELCHITSLVDLTETNQLEKNLKENIDKYQSIFENSSVAILFTSPNGEIYSANEYACNLFGRTKEEIISTGRAGLVDESDPRLFKLLSDRGKNKKAKGHLRFIKKDGSQFEGEVTSVIFQDQNGNERTSMVIRDLTEEIAAKQELVNLNLQMESLTHHLQSIREEERTLLSRELHDNLGQLLTGIKMDISWIKGKLENENQSVLKKVDTVLLNIDNTLNLVRKISSSLRPSELDDLGLVAALQNEIQQTSKRIDANFYLKFNKEEVECSSDISIAVFRIFQESMTNILRHSKAKNISVHFDVEDKTLFLSIKDDGIGIHKDCLTNPNSLGIIGMKERAKMIKGSLKITSEIFKGTQIDLSVPLT